jgi:hypothetical protein
LQSQVGQAFSLPNFCHGLLVPVFHHQASLPLFIQFDTRMPGKHRISAEQAMLFIGSIRERLSIIALTGGEYADALEASSALGIVGGGIYDAMLANCAIKAAPSHSLRTRQLRFHFGGESAAPPSQAFRRAER